MKTCKRKKSYPDWAQYRATDANGRVYVYSEEPVPSIATWGVARNALETYVKRKPQPKDFTTTLRLIEG